VPLPRSQLGRLQQLGHADDAVHRRADLVAHARQKLALGAAGALRRLLGARSLHRWPACSSPIRLAQVFGALRHLLLEELAILFEARVAMANLRQHLIEAFDQRADLILGTSLNPQSVVLLGRYALHGLRQG
jgi:hypothetical protein